MHKVESHIYAFMEHGVWRDKIQKLLKQRSKQGSLNHQIKRGRVNSVESSGITSTDGGSNRAIYTMTTIA